MDREVVALAERLTEVVGEVVAVVGAYVHGSAALGGFVPGLSDVDLLFVVDGEIEDPVALGREIADAAIPCPGRGVELSVVTHAAAASNTEPWPFVVHVATGSGDARIVSGATIDGDPDLLMHSAVTLAGGGAIVGPQPAEVFGEPHRDDVLAYLADELASAVGGESETYAVLNACRAWQYVETGEIVSKVSGGSWAKTHGGPMLVIGRALSAQMGLLDDRPVTPEAARFVRSVIDRIGPA